MSNNLSFGHRSAAIVELLEGKFMDRRSFLKTSALGGSAAAASTLAAPAYAAGKRVLTMVQSWPRGFAALDDASSYYAKMIGEMSDGALTVDKKAPGSNFHNESYLAYKKRQINSYKEALEYFRDDKNMSVKK